MIYILATFITLLIIGFTVNDKGVDKHLLSDYEPIKTGVSSNGFSQELYKLDGCRGFIVVSSKGGDHRYHLVTMEQVDAFNSGLYSMESFPRLTTDDVEYMLNN